MPVKKLTPEGVELRLSSVNRSALFFGQKRS